MTPHDKYSTDPRQRLHELVAYVKSGLPDLTNRQMALLMLAVIEGPQTVRSVARRLSIQKPVVSRAMSTLVSLGFVKRVPDASDRRSIFIVATEKGKSFLRSTSGVGET